jgi:hypothetical protein
VESTAAQIELVRPWRRATLVAAGVAGLELVLLIILALVLAGRSLLPDVHSAAAARKAPATKHSSVARPAAAKPKPRPPHAGRVLPRAKTGVVVLNGNGISGAAAETAAVVRARGYVVTDTRNAPRSGYPTWRLMTAPGYVAEAKRFARDLDFPLSRIGPLDGMTPRGLHGAKLVLIIGTSR